MSKMTTFRVTVYMRAPFTTLVEATSMKAALRIAEERDGPTVYAFHGDPAEEEWVLGDMYNSPSEFMKDAEIEEE